MLANPESIFACHIAGSRDHIRYSFYTKGNTTSDALLINLQRDDAVTPHTLRVSSDYRNLIGQTHANPREWNLSPKEG